MHSFVTGLETKTNVSCSISIYPHKYECYLLTELMFQVQPRPPAPLSRSPFITQHKPSDSIKSCRAPWPPPRPAPRSYTSISRPHPPGHRNPTSNSNSRGSTLNTSLSLPNSNLCMSSTSLHSSLCIRSSILCTPSTNRPRPPCSPRPVCIPSTMM